MAARRRQPAEVCGDRAGQRHAGQLVRQYQARGDDLAVVEPQLGQLIQPQFEEVHSVWSPVPDAAGGARGEQRVPREADRLHRPLPPTWLQTLVGVARV